MVVSLVLTFFTSLFGLFLLFAIRPSKYGNAIAIEKGKVRCKKSKNDVSEECVKGSCSTDVIIVGAGVAGAALAHTLGKVRRKMDGRHVRVIERDLKEPNRIVGEYLQPGGYLKLVELGLQDCLEEIDAQRVLGYALFKDGKSTRLPYPLEKFHSDVAGRGFHNGPFIQKMRSKAATLSKSSVQLEQGTVTSLLEENGTVRGVQYKTKDGQQVKAHAALTIVCDGCSSNLRALCASLR